MNEVIFTSSILTLVMALVAIIMVWGLLRMLDKVAGVNFERFTTNANDMAMAIYFAGRFVGACLLVGLIFS